jgi:thiol-disulfide isomerase/thioredoxin
VLSLGGCFGERREEPPAERRIAPEFTLDRLDGEATISLAELRGKTVVIDFWATWCPPCEFQVPELNTFFDAHRGDSDVALYGISVDTDGPDVVQAWVTEKDVRYPILMGGEDLARRYGAVGFPTLIVIAPDGTIHSQHVGLIEIDELERALTEQRAQAASSLAGS